MDRLSGGGGTSVKSSSSSIYSTGGQQQHQPALSSSYMTGQYMYSQNYAQYPGPGAQYLHHHQHHQPQNYTTAHQPQSYGTVVQGYGGGQSSANSSPAYNAHHKKASVRNGDVMKRCRLQAA